MFFFLQKNKLKTIDNTKRLYKKVLAQSRNPDFYTVLQVPDTSDGRFEALIIHCFLIIDTLQSERSKAGHAKAQEFFDAMFIDVERSFREMGIGDLSIPRYMKRMMESFKGRSFTYSQALKDNNRTALKQALRRNVYGTVDDVRESTLDTLADYVMGCSHVLREQRKDLHRGQVEFPEVINDAAEEKQLFTA